MITCPKYYLKVWVQTGLRTRRYYFYAQDGGITLADNDAAYFQTEEDAEDQAKILRRLWLNYEIEVCSDLPTN